MASSPRSPTSAYSSRSRGISTASSRSRTFLRTRTSPTTTLSSASQAGQTVKALVIELNPERQKLGLSIRDLVRRQQREEISRFMQDDTNDGYTLGDLLKEKDDGKKNG